MIPYFNTKAGTYLVLPLTGHDFSICSWDLYSSKQACSIMCVTQNSSKAILSSNCTIKWSLGSWISSFWPAKRPSCEMVFDIEECVFLFNTEPRFKFLCLLHDMIWIESKIRICRSHRVLKSIETKSFAQYKNIITLSERIRVKSNRFNQDFTVNRVRLPSRGSIKVPFREIIKTSHFLT